ncbi:phytanoyl-CoA dioxygenase family protein [Pseudofulvibacter geojedonensis]|uniref:Phytanoyl-CoA dioxygenase family protein n=1 Tax=Pseudofulvibacter geojedonensis TaxID=1123758 RepID=A0ABW3I5W0_9FLAO
MERKKCRVYIDKEPFEFEVEGDFFWGKDETLFQKENNVISKVKWIDKGYSIVKAFGADEFLSLQKSIKENVIRALKDSSIFFNEECFELEKYHEVVKTDEEHFQVISKTRELTVSDLDFDIESLTQKFGAVLGCKLTSWVEELQKSHVQVRISRPNSLDINPPHRDGYLSFWEDIINIWVPISGCNEKSSLPIVSGSHMLPENKILRTSAKGAKINGNVYNVPCILESSEGDFQMTRPNPKQGEALLFSPFLIHGSAVNQNLDITRVALELRFPKIS